MIPVITHVVNKVQKNKITVIDRYQNLPAPTTRTGKLLSLVILVTYVDLQQ